MLLFVTNFTHTKVLIRFRCTNPLCYALFADLLVPVYQTELYQIILCWCNSAISHVTEQENGIVLSNVTANLGKVYQMVLYLIIRQGLLSRITNIAHQHLLSQDHLKIERMGHCYISISSQHILAYQIYT